MSILCDLPEMLNAITNCLYMKTDCESAYMQVCDLKSSFGFEPMHNENVGFMMCRGHSYMVLNLLVWPILLFDYLLGYDYIHTTIGVAVDSGLVDGCFTYNTK